MLYDVTFWIEVDEDTDPELVKQARKRLTDPKRQPTHEIQRAFDRLLEIAALHKDTEKVCK